ncbi:MAG TPA: GTPase [Anaeromyxobacteraceae bacterium]|nr:GTPase [Anaeromyxobacteraceae bacterium]
MSTVNPLAREISAKIVYYGPGLSGKTTSLQHVHKVARPETRGELISLSTEGDRTLFFDFLPLKIEQIRGLTLRLQLYTVPGQVFYDATRKLVLNGADGVVFVADSQPAARDSNLESVDNLATNLAELGIDLTQFPLVLQFNKRDLREVMPVARMRTDLNPRQVPDFETVANRGVGVLDALREITKLVVRGLKARQPLHRAHTMEMVRGGGSELASSISDAAEETPPPQPSAQDRARLEPLSFARLFEDRARAVETTEHAIAERMYGEAVRSAAHAISELLAALPVEEGAAAARASLLGLDGREYLRLSRLAARPDAALTERDALFALYLLVAALLKAERI